MSDDERRRNLLAARARLLRVLGEITDSAQARSLTRCPYRTRTDVCTFRGKCRNQVERARAPHACAGGQLDPTPPTAEEIAATLL